ncbi:MAG: hypothetical protein ACRD2P_07280 [Terriglobia bacterium]
MPEKVTRNRLRDFLRVLSELGGATGNRKLRTKLGWEEDFYWRVQGQLIEKGQITAGRGFGGSVKLTRSLAFERDGASSETLSQDAPSGAPSGAECQNERELYPRLKAVIETKWIQRFGFDEFKVDETHTRGKKETGGTYTRPDITAVGIRRYVYLSKTLEVITFEVKASWDINVLGVLEAIAHREAANRSYVIYAASRQTFEESKEDDRIVELAQKHGVGIILANKVDSVEDWEILLDSLRHDPDPARLDRFLGDLPSEEMKKQLSKWR